MRLGAIMAVTETISEEMFRRFCKQNRIRYTRIIPSDEQGKKFPDFWMYRWFRRILVEIKQLEPNEEDKVHINELESNGVTSVREVKTANRVRKKIDSAMPQLRTRPNDRTPAICVLYSTISLDRSFIDPFHVLTAMYGEEVVDIGLPVDPIKSPYVRGIRFGGKRKVSSRHNTTLSAVLTLHINPGEENITSSFYHNAFCTAPLRPRCLRGRHTRHYWVKIDDRNTFREWEKF